MPFLVAALAESALVGALVLETGITASVIASSIVQGSLLVASIGYSNYARRKAQRSANANLQDRMVPVRASDAPRTIVYGETRVAGALIYAAVHGSKREKLTTVYALAGHELASISAYWLNDAAVTLDGSGNVTSTPWGQTFEEPFSEDWTGGGLNSTHVLTTADTLIAVDSVAIWSEADIGGGGLSVGRVSSPITEWTVNLSTKTITITSADYAGLPITATCRVRRAASYVQIRAFLGIAAGQRDTTLETDTASDSAPWTSAHIGRNVPRLHITHTWNESAFSNGLPTPTAVVRGKKVYDPRLDSTNGGSGSQRVADSTTWTWSRNPALCAADYLMSDLGFGVASSKVNWASVRTAANICDESVPLSVGSQARYTCDGVLSTDATRKANLEAILSCMIGSAYFSGGQWYIRAAAYVNPDLDLDETDLADGAISVRARAPRSELFNAVRGRFRDPSNLYQVTDFPPYSSSTYASEDNGETIYEDIELALVDDARRAQRIAKLILYRSRQALTVEATFKLPALVLQPGDTCRLTIARYGWTNKVFRVVECEFAEAAAVRLVLQEDASAIYAWDYNEATNPDPAPNTSLPDPRYVAAPLNVTFTSSDLTFYSRPDGTVVPYVEVSWTVPAADDVSIEIYWKRAAETEYRLIVAPRGASYAWIEDVARGDTINVYLQAVNSIGARSAIYWQPLYNVSSALQSNAGFISVNWIENSTLRNGLGSWVLGSGANANVSLLHLTAANLTADYVLAGTPSDKGSGLFVYESGDRPGNGVTDVWVGQPSAVYPVTPGDLIEGSAYVASQRCAVDLRVLYYDVNGNYVTESVLATPPKEYFAATLKTLSSYTRIGGFATVPANAVRAMLFLRKYGRTSSPYAGSYAFATNLFLGPALVGQTQLSPWSEGVLRTVSTTDLMAGAATNIVRGTTIADSLQVFSSGLTPTNDMTTQGSLASAALVRADVDCTAEIVINMLVTVTNPAAATGGVVLCISRSDGNGQAFYKRRVVSNPTLGFYYTQAVSIETETLMLAGQEVTISCRVYAEKDDANAVGGVNATVQNTTMKATLVKR